MVTESIPFLEVARQTSLRHTTMQRTDYAGSFRRNSLLTAYLTDRYQGTRKKKIVETSKRKLQRQMYKLRVNEELDVFMQDQITFMCFFI